jgi:carboxyl-terminal processing protease
MENNQKNFVIAGILIVLAFVGGFYFNQLLLNQYYKTAYSIDGIDFSLLKKVYDQTTANYVDPAKIDKSKLTYGAAEGLVSAIGDPYTEFFDPTDAKKLEEDLSGSFEGIGIQVGVKNDLIKVIAPIKGTPAEKAGLRAGDVIVAVDSKSTSGMAIDDVVSMMRGAKGTKVTLTIQREGEKNTQNVEITRAVIVVPSMSWEMKQTASGKKVAYFTLSQFSDTIYQDFKKAAYEAIDGGATGIVLDLRDNPGGLVDQSVDIAGWFLDKGQLVLSEQDRDGTKVQYNSAGPSTFSSYPLVVLINQGSASASEILAGALRDDRGATIIGETSFGKGTVQKIMNLDGGSALKVTVAKWYTPSGQRIQDTGITPTIEVKMTADDYDNKLDPQRDRALQEIDKIIK